MYDHILTIISQTKKNAWILCIVFFYVKYLVRTLIYNTSLFSNFLLTTCENWITKSWHKIRKWRVTVWTEIYQYEFCILSFIPLSALISVKRLPAKFHHHFKENHLDMKVKPFHFFNKMCIEIFASNKTITTRQNKSWKNIGIILSDNLPSSSYRPMNSRNCQKTVIKSFYLFWSILSTNKIIIYEAVRRIQFLCRTLQINTPTDKIY